MRSIEMTDVANQRKRKNAQAHRDFRLALPEAKKATVKVQDAETHRNTRSNQPADKKSAVQDQDAEKHRKVRSNQPADKKASVKVQDADKHRRSYQPAKASEHAMQTQRNAYMKKVLHDCATGVAPPPLAEQKFTKYFMTQWSD